MGELIPKGEIGKKIAILAKAVGLTQKEIAETCKISRMSVHRFFKGETELKAKEFLKILEILGLFSEKEMNFKIQEKINGDYNRVSSSIATRPFIFS